MKKVVLALGMALLLAGCEDDGHTRVKASLVTTEVVMIEGQLFRFDFDAPDPSGACLAERILGQKAREEVASLVAANDFRIVVTERSDDEGIPIINGRVSLSAVGVQDIAGRMIEKGYGVLRDRGYEWCSAT